MTKKLIQSITPEQERQIPVYIRRWVEEASKPIDREIAFSHLKRLYPEHLIVFTESLQNTLDLIQFVRVLCNAESLVKDSQLDSQLYSQLRSQLDSQLDSQLYSQLDSQLDSQLGRQLYSQLGRQLYSQLDSQLRSQLGSQLYSQLGRQLYSQLGRQLYSQLDSQLRSQLGSSPIKWSYYISYFWYAWAGWYEYSQYIGVELDTDNLTEFVEILRNTPLVVFVGNLIFVCGKPRISWNNTLLHHEADMAIKWQDGTGLYFLDGVHLEKVLWTAITSGSMSFDDILKIENADERAIALKYNKNAIIASGADLLDEDPQFGELFCIKDKQINAILEERELYFMRMKCPTGRTFVECVEPQTARDILATFDPKYAYITRCQAAAFNIPVEIYGHLQQVREG